MSSTPLIARDACTSTTADAPRDDASILHHHGHVAELGINIVHGPDGHAVPMFSNLPLFAIGSGPNSLATRINELLAARKSSPRASDALEQLTVLNDALGRVLVDPDLGLYWEGCPVRGCDLLSALLPPQSPGRTHDALPSAVRSLVGCAKTPKTAPAPPRAPAETTTS